MQKVLVSSRITIMDGFSDQLHILYSQRVRLNTYSSMVVHVHIVARAKVGSMT